MTVDIVLLWVFSEEEVVGKTPEKKGDNSANLVTLNLWRVEVGRDSLLDPERGAMCVCRLTFLTG